VTRPERDIAGAEAAHRRLDATLAAMSEDDVRRPSLLPGWNVAMTLTHIARNADSFRRIIDGAARGEVADQYEHGAEGRLADIEAGRDRGRAEVADDVGEACTRLEDCWAALDDDTWANGRGRFTSGQPAIVHELPFRRWRETDVHHLDLGLGYRVADLPADYVEIELGLALAGLPDRIGADDRRSWLAWLIGRGDAGELGELGPWLPTLPTDHP
jgi:maleylpyruvate isomerase